MQRLEFDLNNSDLISRALYVFDERQGVYGGANYVYQGQGYSSPKVQVGKYESGIMDIRTTNADDSMRKLLLQNNIKYRERKGSQYKDTSHFTLVPDEFEKLVSVVSQLLTPKPGKYVPQEKR